MLAKDKGSTSSSRLHAYAEAWTEVEHQLCRDHALERSTVDLHAARTDCLANGRVTLEALTSLDWAPGLDLALVQRPHAALRSLGDPLRCLGLAASDRPTDRVAVRTAARTRAEVRVLLALQPPGAAAAARARLAELGLPEDPEIQLLHGQTEALAGEVGLARLHFDRAAQLAVVEDPRLAARAWIALAELELDQLVAETNPLELGHRSRGIDQLLDYAEVLLGEGSSPALLELARVRTELALVMGQPKAEQ